MGRTNGQTEARVRVLGLKNIMLQRPEVLCRFATQVHNFTNLQLRQMWDRNRKVAVSFRVLTGNFVLCSQLFGSGVVECGRDGGGAGRGIILGRSQSSGRGIFVFLSHKRQVGFINNVNGGENHIL